MNVKTDILRLSGITKIFSDDYGTKKKVLEDVSFTIPAGSPKIASILASFGSGKSTLFKIISCVEKPTSGEVILGGEKYLQAAGKIVLIPENSSSLPWLNVRNNIELACRLETCGKKDNGISIKDMIGLSGLSGYENHFPHNLSSGFRFRISIARALMFNPFVLLLDDCFKKMDADAREEMYSLICEISQKVDTHFLLATTNVTEALRLSGTIFLMSKEPAKIYSKFEIPGEFINDYKNEKFIEYRRLIEETYNKENQQGTMNFSI